MTRRNRVKPTPKQAKALELIRDGTPPVKAMREAGYAEQTSHAPSANLLRSSAAINYLEQYRAQYAKLGITPKYMAAKTAQWLEAKKVVSAKITGLPAGSQTDDFIEVDDYQTQLKAAELVRKDWGMAQDSTNTFIAGAMKVEFIQGDE